MSRSHRSLELCSRAALAALALAGTVGLSGCGQTGAPARTPPPDLVLVSLDTFRADLLELTRGDGSAELPTLRRLADESISFVNAWSPQPFTLPSHMTMMTGLHPESHGVASREERLAAEVPTLAEHLHAAGYRTLGVACGPWLAPRFGFARGFDYYKDLGMALTFAKRVRGRTRRALAEHGAGEAPLFLFAHFYDAHGDWGGEGNHLSYYSPPHERRDFELPERVLCGGDGAERECAIRFLMKNADHPPLPANEFAALHFELYRRGARALDAELAGFFDELRRSGIWDDAVIVVTADHGEEFGEHGQFVHTQIFRETLRVPLLVKLPRAERGGTRVTRPVALEDIAPTLLARAGVAVPAALQGFDLLSPPRTGAERPLVARASSRRQRYGLRLGSRFLVRDPSAGELRLFDLTADPEERHEIPAGAEERRSLEERLDAALRRLRAERHVALRQPASALDARENAELRALGYLD